MLNFRHLNLSIRIILLIIYRYDVTSCGDKWIISLGAYTMNEKKWDTPDNEFYIPLKN